MSEGKSFPENFYLLYNRRPTYRIRLEIGSSTTGEIFQDDSW